MTEGPQLNLGDIVFAAQGISAGKILTRRVWSGAKHVSFYNSHMVFVKTPDVKRYLWIPDVEDLLADDWEEAQPFYVPED